MFLKICVILAFLKTDWTEKGDMPVTEMIGMDKDGAMKVKGSELIWR